MRSVFVMALKDLRLIARDRAGLFFILGFPILMGILFGSIFGAMDAESESLSVAVADVDQSNMSSRFIDQLAADGKVRIERLDRQQAMDRVRRGSLAGMIVVPKGFGETAGIFWLEGPAIGIGVDPSRKAESGMLQGIVMQSMGLLVSARMQEPESMRPFVQQSRDELASAKDVPAAMRPTLEKMMGTLDEFMQSWQSVQAAEKAGGDDGVRTAGFQLAKIETIDVTREVPKDSAEGIVKKLRSKWDISFPQGMIWGVLACAATFAVTIVRERKQGTLLRLEAAPIARGLILAGKAMACFLAVLGVIAVMVLLGTALGMRPLSPAKLVVAALSIASCFVGIMMAASVIGKTEEAVSGASWGIFTLMAMFGGGMIPLAFMPEFMKTLSNASPVKWAVLALEGAIWRDFTWGEMLLPYSVLLAIGAVCFGIGTFVLSRATN
jgi:ABC-2 type transport system permease protein